MAPGILLALSNPWPLGGELSLVASGKRLNKDSDNTKKVHDKGKKIIMQQKPQTKVWQPRDNPQGIGSSLAFAKPAFDSSSHAHSDKSAFNYQLALENVTDVVIRSNDVESTSVLDLVLQLQHVLVPLTADVQQLEEGMSTWIQVPW